jgi:hypothetical protein
VRAAFVAPCALRIRIVAIDGGSLTGSVVELPGALDRCAGCASSQARGTDTARDPRPALRFALRAESARANCATDPMVAGSICSRGKARLEVFRGVEPVRRRAYKHANDVIEQTKFLGWDTPETAICRSGRAEVRAFSCEDPATSA